MQTLEPVVEPEGGKPPKMRGQGALIFLLAGLIPLSLLLIQTKWGVLFGVGLAVIAGLGLWVIHKGFAFVELVAFLIHFDGLGFSIVRMGRIVAAAAILVILYKLLVEKWRPPAVPARHWGPALLLATWAVMSGAWSHAIGDYMFFLGLLGLGLAFFVTSAFLVDSHEKIHAFLRAYWVGGLWGSLAGVWALVIGTRSVGFGADPNFFGILQASMIPLTIYYRRQAKTQMEKHMYSLVVLFVFAGAAGAGSRSGIIGACIVIVATIVSRPGLSRPKRAQVGAGALVVAGVAFIVMFFANPVNLDRGFADRGAGRLDFWTVTIGLIQENPFVGYGAGQLSTQILPRLPTTPGVQKLDDHRDNVSSHNTWMDLTGDLGIVGSGLFALALLVALFSLLQPRWKQTRELSATLFIMMLPVLSGSNFLPLTNNKLAWSLIGLAAALQVPSWGTRYSGYFSPDTRKQGEANWAEATLARWDLRISRRFRAWVLVGAVIGMVVFGSVISTQPTKYLAKSEAVVPALDQAPGATRAHVSMERVQMLHTLVLTDAYAAELKELSGLPLGIREIRDRMFAERPKFGAFIEITYTDTNEEYTNLAGPHLVEALSQVLVSGQPESEAVLSDELRPMYPGEQRYYDGPLFLTVSGESDFNSEPPRTLWVTLIGGATGALVALALTMLNQRRPRVNNDDDFPNALGMPLWTHVGRVGRRYSATPQQYAHLAITTAEGASEPDAELEMPNRILLVDPKGGRYSRGVAMGLAASIAASGRRVVLIDGQPNRPLMSLRLGGFRRTGIAQVSSADTDLTSVMRRVPRWRLPRSVRATAGDAISNIRFIPAGRRTRGEDSQVDPTVLDMLDDDIVQILVSPPLLGTVPAAPSLRWADVVLYCLVEGGTVTFDAEDGAVRVRTFSDAPAGVVLADV